MRSDHSGGSAPSEGQRGIVPANREVHGGGEMNAREFSFPVTLTFKTPMELEEFVDELATRIVSMARFAVFHLPTPVSFQDEVSGAAQGCFSHIASVLAEAKDA